MYFDILTFECENGQIATCFCFQHKIAQSRQHSFHFGLRKYLNIVGQWAVTYFVAQNLVMNVLTDVLFGHKKSFV